MAENVTTALIGAMAGLIAGSIASIIAPWINWGIEKKKQKHTYRKELIGKWRAMVHASCMRPDLKSLEDVIIFFENHIDFFSLRPHLKTWKDYSNQEKFMGGRNYLPDLSDSLLVEITRIEKEWDLV